MLRSELLDRATTEDIYEYMALEKLRDPEYQKQLKLENHRAEQATRTLEEQEAWILSQLNED